MSDKYDPAMNSQAALAWIERQRRRNQDDGRIYNSAEIAAREAAAFKRGAEAMREEAADDAESEE